MRINQFVASATGMSRRAADKVVSAGRVLINSTVASPGSQVQAGDNVTLDAKPLKQQLKTTIMLNKPVEFVCSRDGQGSKTIYELLPVELGHLKPVGRLDKDSSGLLLLTNDGDLAHKLTHPSFQKEKVYEVELDKPLTSEHKSQIEQGIKLEDGMSKLNLQVNNSLITVRMNEGRNRQIRRTFEALGYKVNKLHRTSLGDYNLGKLKQGEIETV